MKHINLKLFHTLFLVVDIRFPVDKILFIHFILIADRKIKLDKFIFKFNSNFKNGFQLFGFSKS